MKNPLKILLSVITLLFICGSAIADDAEFRLVVSRNDMIVGEEFDVDLEIRMTSGTAPRTLASFNVDIYYSSTLTQWDSNPSTGWTFGTADGYDTPTVSRLSGYYRIFITSSGVNSSDLGSPPGNPAGWDVTMSWKKITTLRWYINTTSSVNITISDVTDAAGYYVNYTNAPKGSQTNFTNVSNQDLGDVSLPVQMSEMKATASSKQGIVLSWATESEVNSSGFHVWRSERESSDYARISTALIPSHGNSSARNEYSFTDANVKGGLTYWYKIEEVSTAGESRFNGPISVLGMDRIPDKFALSQNYPNPFNPETKFSYDLPEDSKVGIRIYSLLGKEMKTLEDGQKSAGHYTLTWDGKDNLDRMVSSGIYFIQMQAGNFSSVRKIMFIR
jgi:hypothetical protein